jgi:hypothetical protein
VVSRNPAKVDSRAEVKAASRTADAPSVMSSSPRYSFSRGIFLGYRF